MKKIIALMLFVCLMLVACGQNDGGDVESSKIESNAVESSNESSLTSTDSSEESSEAESKEESSDAESSEVSSESSEVSAESSKEASEEASEVSAEASEEASEVESSEPVIESSEPVESIAPEVPSQPEVPEVSENPTEPTLDAWKQAYIDYIEQTGRGTYALAYVDGDNIPELYICGMYAIDGCHVISYKNGAIVEVHGGGGVGYIERSGLLHISSGHTGYYYDYVYTLDNNGFTNIFKAYREEILYSEDYYYINDEPVSEEEYNNAIKNAFDSSNATWFSYIDDVSYDEIKQMIMAY